MQDIANDLQWQIADMDKLLKLQAPRRDSAPRGLIARVTLRLQGNSVSNDVCCHCDCREHLAICSLCSHWVCAEHRILLGAVNLDDDGRSLGGVNVMCANAPLCDRRQYWVIEKLGKGVSVLDKGSKGRNKGSQGHNKGSKGCNKGSKGYNKGSTGGKGKGHEGSRANGW